MDGLTSSNHLTPPLTMDNLDIVLSRFHNPPSSDSEKVKTLMQQITRSYPSISNHLLRNAIKIRHHEAFDSPDTIVQNLMLLEWMIGLGYVDLNFCLERNKYLLPSLRFYFSRQTPPIISSHVLSLFQTIAAQCSLAWADELFRIRVVHVLFQQITEEENSSTLLLIIVTVTDVITSMHRHAKFQPAFKRRWATLILHSLLYISDLSPDDVYGLISTSQTDQRIVMKLQGFITRFAPFFKV
ncbi:hypothetical protein BLNAU_9465 [Blattamonas nauphoetae]|uniref:Uncharacterized protein n=1 Tax=Blattamonas nauphoetae TaxID=2049346 RepID=A0ABQ9XVW8_9EUKA|nr:hypothetical protein BLNAU_9465 [Blattamonas nauphoetae]